MKLLFLLLIALPTVGLSQIPGSNFNGPLKTKYGEFHEGDTLRVGTGSNPNGDFKFIYQPPNGIWGTKQINLDKMYSNTRLIIKHFREWDSSTFGLKEFTIVRWSIINAVVELEAAIEAGEIIVPNYIPNKGNFMQPISVADEIGKLKKLLDSGAITQAEYDTQKKKLLGM